MALTKITRNGITDSAVNSAKVLDGTIVDADISSSANIAATKFGFASNPPTITGITPTELTTTSGGAITVTGTNFVSIPNVVFQNTSTGALITASAVSFTSSTSVAATFPSGGASGTYKLRLENPNGFAAEASSSITYSNNPTWSTGAGSIGSVSAGDSVSLSVSGSSDSTVAYSETTSVLTSNANTPAATMNLTLNSSTGAITGTAPSPTTNTTYNFTLRLTDAESQTTDRAFSITVSTGATGGGQFTP